MKRNNIIDLSEYFTKQQEINCPAMQKSEKSSIWVTAAETLETAAAAVIAVCLCVCTTVFFSIL